MKKVLYSVISVASAAAIALGLTACGSKAARIKGEEVSEEQWKSALAVSNLANVKIVESKDVICKSGLSTTGSANYKRTITFADHNLHVVTEQTVKDDISFYLDNKTFYDWTPQAEYKEYYIEGADSAAPIYYIKTDGGWEKKTTLDPSETTAYINVYAEYSYSFAKFSEGFGGYKYQTENKGGYAPTETVPKSYLLKIEDGLLKALYVPEVTFEQEKNKYAYDEGVVYSYGGESVTVPEV